MFELKPLSRDAIPAALQKAERYRFLNEPAEAESICLDVLEVDPDHGQALVILLLALTDQFQHGVAGPLGRARAVLPRLQDEYERAYYEGIINERRAKAVLDQGAPGFGVMAYEFLTDAMSAYERAEAIRPSGNDDAVLRWNTCARLLNENRDLKPRGQESFEPLLLE
jgi:hypothetical protein